MRFILKNSEFVKYCSRSAYKLSTYLRNLDVGKGSVAILILLITRHVYLVYFSCLYSSRATLGSL